MALSYRLQPDQAEPMSRYSLVNLRTWGTGKAYQNDVLMTSSRTQQLSTYLKQYCDGRIDGFSVLLAGQRGAGKTTLTKLIIQNAIRESTGLIPLPIFLHGPTVIDPEANSKESKTKQPPLPSSVVVNIRDNGWVPPADPASRPAPQAIANETDYGGAILAKEQALPKLMAALYRGLSEAICDAWRNAAYHSDHGGRSTFELLELAAHLDRTLDLAPGVEPLRKIWARAGFLRNGVAFYLRPRNARRMSVRPPQIAGDQHDQGFREIIALAVCAEAYRSVIGKVEEKLTQSAVAEQNRKYGSPAAAASAEKTGGEKPEGNAKEGVKALGPPAIGAVVGFAASFGPHPVLSVLAGAAGWVASWFALNYGINRTAKLSQGRESTLEVDWEPIRILERRFPALIRRVKDAGFAPIFVFDELDKVPRAYDKLYNFLLLTKHIVTDEASFFFLVNRDYYEHMERLNRALSQP